VFGAVIPDIDEEVLRPPMRVAHRAHDPLAE
jgi:hypothetical protein